MTFDREKLIDSKLVAGIVNDVAAAHLLIKTEAPDHELVERLRECAIILAQMAIGIEKSETERQQLKPQSSTVIM
jgi:hypothetical protein